jgi:predicted transcriptional regulator
MVALNVAGRDSHERPSGWNSLSAQRSGQEEEAMNELQPHGLSTDLPPENPLRFLRRTSATDAKLLSNEEERRLTAELKQTAEASQAMRISAHRDAIIVVARAMERRGQNPTCWTEKDVEAARKITEIVIDLDSQGANAPDPAFARWLGKKE